MEKDKDLQEFFDKFNSTKYKIDVTLLEDIGSYLLSKKALWQREAREEDKEKASAVALCPQCNDWMHRKDMENEYYCFGCDKNYNLVAEGNAGVLVNPLPDPNTPLASEKRGVF